MRDDILFVFIIRKSPQGVVLTLQPLQDCPSLTHVLTSYFKYLGSWGGITDRIVEKQKTTHNKSSPVCPFQRCCEHWANGDAASEITRRSGVHRQKHTVQSGFKSFSSHLSFFLHCSVVPLFTESRGVSLLLSAHRSSSASVRTIAYSFTWSVMFLWSKARLCCLSHIFKWIPWAFGSGFHYSFQNFHVACRG